MWTQRGDAHGVVYVQRGPSWALNVKGLQGQWGPATSGRMDIIISAFFMCKSSSLPVPWVMQLRERCP